jgi:agmatine deiminase
MPLNNSVGPHYWPAEWESHAAMWISWPHNRETWPGRFDSIPEHFRAFIETISAVEPVHVLSGPAGSEPSAWESIYDLSNVVIHDIRTNDSWIRDYGPTFVRRRDDDSLVGVDWKYNAWGNKYPPFDDDAAAAEQICWFLQCQRSVSALYCEGGALETDGQGTLLTTSSCLMSPQRNPGWSRGMIEQELRLQLGIATVIWVDGGGLQGDDTDGHIDQLARFVDRESVVVATSSDPQDPNCDGLEENFRILSKAKNAQGRSIRTLRLPTPRPRFIGSARVPESYCNFLIANEIVLVPTFRSPQTDEAAVDLLSEQFPSRKIVPMDAYDLVWGLGAFHCASQQQPTSKPRKSKKGL